MYPFFCQYCIIRAVSAKCVSAGGRGKESIHMIALQLTDIKGFMNCLLRSEVFDNFLLQEAVITSAATYMIDGRINRDFFSSEELEESGLTEHKALPFSMLRGNCFDLIKGKKTPSAFRFVFLLSPANLRNTLASCGSSYRENDISGIFMNLKYQNGTLILTTGISYRIFSTDKSLESQWDQLVKRFLKQNGISFEEL